jgi:glutathione synthase/RimK-type ligase-like ATP-grasp enzyme
MAIDHPGAARIALATCSQVALGDDDLPDLTAQLALRGIQAQPVVWDEPTVDWDAFDRVVLRSTWDYPPRREAFLAWTERISDRLHNSAAIVRWNTDKHYLRELERAGVAVVPTHHIEPADPISLPERAFVVKPAISAGAKDTVRYAPGEVGRAREQIVALQRAGRSVMVQPYLDRIDAMGETALIFFDGVFSHAIRKGPILVQGAPATAGLFAPEEIEPREARAEEIELALQALATVPADGPLLYARVDLVPDEDRPVVLEVELVEPSLFLAHSDGAAERFAAAIAKRL